MSRHSLYNLCQSSAVAIVVGVTLIFSFGLHSVELNHQHPGHEHAGGTYHPGEKETVLVLNEYIHASEQKMFLVVLLAILLVGSLLRPTFLNYSWSAFFERAFLETFRTVRSQYQRYIHVEDYLQHMLKSGILHPKLF